MPEVVKNSFLPSGFKPEAILPYMRLHQYLAAAIVSWIVIALLAVFYVFPQISGINDLLSQINEGNQKFTALKAQVDFLHALNPETLSSEVNDVTVALPQSKPVLPLLTTLQSFAQLNSVSIGDLKLNPGQVGTGSAALSSLSQSAFTGVSSLPFQLSVTG